MGINYFEHVVENGMGSNCFQDVHLGQLACHYYNTTGKKPVMVVDGTYFLHHFYSRAPGIHNDFVCGGQFKGFMEFMRFFMHNLQALNIEPIFYFDGPTHESRINYRKERNDMKKKELRTLFNKMGSKTWIEFQQGYKSILPILMSIAGRFIIKYVCDCKVLVSLKNCDEELASYAYKESCFAILSQDTDLLCMKNARYYLSIKHLNILTMTTKLYDRSGVLNYYGFSSLQQMWLFASLSGNDMIPCKKLRKFHVSLCGDPFTHHGKFKKVSEFVKKISMHCSNDIEQAVPAVLTLLNSLNVDIGEDELLASLRSYQPRGSENWIMYKNVEEPWLQVLEMAHSRHVTCDAVPDVYNTLAGHPYEVGLFLEKPELHDQGSARIFLPLRQRIYSVLLHEKPWGSAPREVKEFGTWDGQWHDIQGVSIPELPPGVDHPGLIALWTKDNQRINLQRWNLFAQMIVPWLNPNVFERLSCHYVVPVAVILYLMDAQRAAEFRGAESCEQPPQNDLNEQQDKWWMKWLPKLAFNTGQQEFEKEQQITCRPLQQKPAKQLVKCNLTESEVESFIQLAVAVSYLKADKLNPQNLLGNKCPTIRMVNLSTLFGYGISMVLFLMSVLGFPLDKAMPWHYYDGPLFHYFLFNESGRNALSRLLFDPNEIYLQNHIMEDIEIIRSIINSSRYSRGESSPGENGLCGSNNHINS